jgi:hypothetical protein
MGVGVAATDAKWFLTRSSVDGSLVRVDVLVFLFFLLGVAASSLTASVVVADWSWSFQFLHPWRRLRWWAQRNSFWAICSDGCSAWKRGWWGLVILIS